MKKNHINLITVIILLITIALACKKDKLVSDVALTPSTFMLTIDETAILTATVYPHDAANKTINWASSNNDVATIDNGKITAIAVGTVIITVTTEDGNHKAICTVEVISPLHPAEPEMIFVEGGTFTMGCTDDECWGDGRDKPAHQVTLRSFKIAKYPVTQKQWVAIMGSNPCPYQGDELPVHFSSKWDLVQEFIQKLNEITGKNYRLPTEAEWEFAARGGNKSKGYKYSGSNDIDAVAWYWGNSEYKYHPVGLKEPNELGIYDMSGNVWEWCNDWYGVYTEEPLINPQGPTTGLHRVIRGGSRYSRTKQFCRVSHRGYELPDGRSTYIGIRLVLP